AITDCSGSRPNGCSTHEATAITIMKTVRTKTRSIIGWDLRSNPVSEQRMAMKKWRHPQLINDSDKSARHQKSAINKVRVFIKDEFSLGARPTCAPATLILILEICDQSHGGSPASSWTCAAPFPLVI